MVCQFEHRYLPDRSREDLLPYGGEQEQAMEAMTVFSIEDEVYCLLLRFHCCGW